MSIELNDLALIIDAFKNNQDFYLKIIKDALNINDEKKAKTIDRARIEIREGFKYSNETKELIKENAEEYIKIINFLNEEKDKNNVNENNNTKKENQEEKKEENQEEKNSQVSNDNQDVENIENTQNTQSVQDNINIDNNSFNNDVIIDDTNYVFSSVEAKRNLEAELANITNRINVLEANINNSTKMPKKSDYRQLFQLKSYRDKLTQKLESINLEESYSNDSRIANRDARLSDINNRMKEVHGKLQNNKPKFVQVILQKRLKNLKNKQGKIQDKQRTVVSKDLSKYYKSAMKTSKTDNLDNAIDEYYKHKEERLTEKRNAILDNVDEYNNSIINSIKNKFYKFKSLPTSARIVYIQGLQQKEGTFKGFTQLKESIGNKLKKKKYQSNKQQIEYLNQLKEGYINLQQMADNLANNAAQPQLEATSGKRL